MKVTCQQPNLLLGLSTVVRAIAKQPPQPILQNVFLTTEHGGLKLAATDLDMTICCWIDAKVEEEGTTTLPAKFLTDFVESLRTGPVNLTFSEETHRVRFTSLHNLAHIQGTEPSEFPALPTIESDASSIIFEASALKEIIHEVIIAASNDSARAPLNGVYVELQGEQITFVAADSYRLAMRVTHLPGRQAIYESLLIPARTLSELARILPDEGTVQMLTTTNNAQVLFHTDTLDLTSGLFKNTYPNFRKSIPEHYTTRAVVDVKEFTAIVKSVLPFSSNALRTAHVTLAPDKSNGLEPGSLTLEAETEGVGENISSIRAAVDGPEQHIVLNAKYLSECLAVLRTPEVALELLSASKPAILRPVNFTDYLYMVIPSNSTVPRPNHTQKNR